MESILEQGSIGKIPEEKEKKRWPWWMWPITPYSGPRRLVECSCGRVMWLDALQTVRKHHQGHRSSVCEHASFTSFIKLKLGLMERRTVSELWQDFLSRFLS